MSDPVPEQTLPQTNDNCAACNFCKSIFLQPRMAGGFIEHSVYSVYRRLKWRFSLTLTLKLADGTSADGTEIQWNERCAKRKCQSVLGCQYAIWLWKHGLFKHCRHHKIPSVCRLWNGTCWILWPIYKEMLRCSQQSNGSWQIKMITINFYLQYPKKRLQISIFYYHIFAPLSYSWTLEVIYEHQFVILNTLLFILANLWANIIYIII